MKVSVIIPVFNAAKTLQSAIDSLLEQSFRDFEICLVDDCSTDGSRTLIENLDDAIDSVRIKKCFHESNMGVACARNTGLDSAEGEWICFVDADDRIAPDALSAAVRSAEESNAELIGWDWMLCSDAGSRYMRQADCNTPVDALKALAGGVLRWNLWLYMFRKHLFDGVRFKPGLNMGEDMMALSCILSKTASFAQLHKSLYLYTQTDASISRSMSSENLRQVCANLEIASNCFKNLPEMYMDFLKLNVKLPLLISTDVNDYRRWAECYPEATKSIMLNTCLPFRTRALQMLASKRIWAGVKLYNLLVYGILDRLRK